MKKLKRATMILLTSMFLLVTVGENVMAAIKDKNGFSYDTSVYNTVWKTKEYLKVYSEGGGLLGTMSYIVGMAREKGTSDYLLMTKEIMTPNNNKVKITNNYVEGGYRIGELYGYGFSEYVSVNSPLPGEMGEYIPKNTPSNNQGTLQLGVSSTGPSVGITYKIEKNDLKISSYCNTPKNLYYIAYDYIPTRKQFWLSNEYVANESSQYGMVQFELPDNCSRFGFFFNYTATFGASMDKARSPYRLLDAKWNSTATKTRFYDFSIPKN